MKTIEGILTSVCIGTLSLGASAFGSFVGELPQNVSQTVGADSACMTCHSNASGGAGWNDFGLEFKAAYEDNGRVASGLWSTVCGGDADGDGQSNGFELGDPCCEWAGDNDDVLWPIADGGHPGDGDVIALHENVEGSCEPDNSDTNNTDTNNSDTDDSDTDNSDTDNSDTDNSDTDNSDTEELEDGDSGCANTKSSFFGFALLLLGLIRRQR